LRKLEESKGVLPVLEFLMKCPGLQLRTRSRPGVFDGKDGWTGKKKKDLRTKRYSGDRTV